MQHVIHSCSKIINENFFNWNAYHRELKIHEFACIIFALIIITLSKKISYLFLSTMVARSIMQREHDRFEIQSFFQVYALNR